MFLSGFLLKKEGKVCNESLYLTVSLISAPVLSSLSLLFLFSSVLARLSTLCEAHRQGSLKAEEMRVFFALKENVCKNNLQRSSSGRICVARCVFALNTFECLEFTSMCLH